MITDPHFVIYGNEIDSKRVQFPSRGAPNKLIGAANYDLQLPVYNSKFSALGATVTPD